MLPSIFIKIAFIAVFIINIINIFEIGIIKNIVLHISYTILLFVLLIKKDKINKTAGKIIIIKPSAFKFVLNPAPTSVIFAVDKLKPLKLECDFCVPHDTANSGVKKVSIARSEKILIILILNLKLNIFLSSDIYLNLFVHGHGAGIV